MNNPFIGAVHGAAPAQCFEDARLLLARTSVAPGGNWRQALQSVVEVAARAIGVNRISIWRFVDNRDAIRCEFLYHVERHIVSEGTILHARDFPTYFRSLEIRRVVPIVDIEGDPVTQEFREPYFQPLGITSMLDAPIYEAGAMVGIVCHEQIGPKRYWTALDCEFAAAVADAIARLHQEAEHSLAEQRLNAYRDRMADLQRLGDLGRLAAGMAHDFNNVLQAILGYADEVIEVAHGQASVKTLTEKLVAAAKRGSDLAGELLSLGRQEPCRPRVIGLGDVIEQFRDMLDKAAGPNVMLKIADLSHASRVFVDPAQIERAVLNLVLNARDAMPSGGTIVISLGEVTRAPLDRDPGAYVVLVISDTGQGMDLETQSRMFEPMFTTKGERGTGLGLAIVNQVVTLAGGFIDVESALGRGTTIRIHLPKIA